MNHPDRNWLSAYYDGELHGEKRRRVESHLAGCEQCRGDLKSFKEMSALVQAAPPVSSQGSPLEFTASVLSRLPESPEAPAWESLLRFGWKLAPFAIFLLWAFLQAVFLATNLFQLLLPIESIGARLAGILLVAGAGLGGFGGSLLSIWLEPLIESLGTPEISASPALLVLFSLTATAVSAVLLWGWLASWWAYQGHRSEIVGS